MHININTSIKKEELNELLRDVVAKNCDPRVKNLLIDIGANPNSIGVSMYDIITMTPEQAKECFAFEIKQKNPDMELIQNILEHSVIDYGSYFRENMTYSSLIEFVVRKYKTHKEFYTWLIQRPDFTVNTQDDNGMNVLIWALKLNEMELVTSILVDQDHPEIDVNLQNSGGETALMNASALGQTEIVRMLLERPEIDVNLQNPRGDTALMRASQFGRTEIVKGLLERPEILVNLQDSGGWTALIRASANGRTEIVQMLLERPEIDVNLQNRWGRTALMWASQYANKSESGNSSKILELLLQRPEIDKSLKDKNKRSAWVFAKDKTRIRFPELKNERKIKP